jgi:large subunit ribosomal protein L24
LALSGDLQLDGVDGTALRYRGLTMPSGKASMRMTWASQGRSIAALTGALTGSGTLTIDAARIPGLNPDVFDMAIKASDGGKAANEDQLRQIVAPELLRGELAVKQAQIPFILRDGRVSVGATTLQAEGARAVVSGGYDIVADQLDVRANLTSSAVKSVNGSPQLEVFAVGTPDALTRNVDVAGLSSWLALRVIDRETRRLDAISRGEAAPQTLTAPTPPAKPETLKPEASKPEAPKPEAAKPAEPPPPPIAEVPLPDGDPRRAPAKPKDAAPKKPPPPQATDAGTGPAVVAPLPPPIEVRPAPGAKAAPKPHAPLILTPPTGREQRSGL